MAKDEIVFQFRSRPEYFFIAVLVIMSVFFTFVAVGLCQQVRRNCLMSASSCSAGMDGVAVAVLLAALLADAMTGLTIPWLLAGTYRLVITKKHIELIARRRHLILEPSAVASYKINIVKSRVELYNKKNRRNFKNWAGNAPEYSGSAVDFCVTQSFGRETLSFPLGAEFNEQTELKAALSQLNIH